MNPAALEPGRSSGRGEAPHPVRDLKAFLSGTWTIVRTIRDRRIGATGTFRGEARFSPAPDGLLYHEAGRLAIGGHDGPAEQTYRYGFPAPGRAELRFRDGRPFHILDLSTGSARAVHACAPDLYRARFRVLGPAAWCAVWRIRGPRKALLIASLFTRAGLTSDARSLTSPLAFPTDPPPMLKILFVCTGNICRSPTAEGVLRHRLQQENLAGQVETLSAGTHGYHVGEPADARAQRTAKTRGYDLSRLRARQVTPDHFQEFDLILAMDRSHQLALRRLAPPEARDRIRLFMDFAPGAGQRDVPDPYYGEADDFELVLDLIEAGVEGLVAAIRRGEIGRETGETGHR